MEPPSLCLLDCGSAFAFETPAPSSALLRAACGLESFGGNDGEFGVGKG